MGRMRDKIATEEGFNERAKRIDGKLLIGYGFDIEAIDIPVEVADYWLSLIIDKLRDALSTQSWFSNLDESRSIAIVDMAHQMGIDEVLALEYMVLAIEWKNWEEASRQLLDSKYAQQTPARASRNAEILRTGIL